MRVSKKVKNNIDTGLWASYGHPDDNYIAAVIRQPETSDYLLAYHHGEMPAFDSETFETLAELETVMRRLEPDLRKWRTKFE